MQRKALAGAIAGAAIAASVWAGVIFVPVGNVYTDLAAAPVSAVASGAAAAGSLTIRSGDLRGTLTLDCSGAENACLAQGLPPGGTPFTERSELRVDRSEGTVSGRVDGRLDEAGYRYRGQISGTASCAEPQDSRCRRLLLSFETRAVLFDNADASRVGRIEQESLGSLVLDGDGSRWAALGSTGTLGFVSAP